MRERAEELRQAQTSAEQELWKGLRKEQVAGCKFRRQQPLGRFIVDFYCPSVRLVIEVDGESHLNRVEYDAARAAYLQALGCRVLRFINLEVYRQREGVLATIWATCQELSTGSRPPGFE